MADFGKLPGGHNRVHNVFTLPFVARNERLPVFDFDADLGLGFRVQVGKFLLLGRGSSFTESLLSSALLFGDLEHDLVVVLVVVGNDGQQLDTLLIQ